jgi:hypothetical protein
MKRRGNFGEEEEILGIFGGVRPQKIPKISTLPLMRQFYNKRYSLAMFAVYRKHREQPYKWEVYISTNYGKYK